MIRGEFMMGTAGRDATAYLRTRVFTGELNFDPGVEQDVYDHFGHHLIVKDGQEMIGSGRLIYKDHDYLIGRIAVEPEARGQKIGDLIVRMLCDRAFNIGAETVTVHALVDVVPFYEKIGFKKTSDVFQEGNLDHVSLTINEKQLAHDCGSCGACD